MELREMFGMVLQDTWLFHGTIMENIRYGRLDATDEEVIAMAADFLSIMALWCFTNGVYNSTSGLFQGSGHTEVTMAVDATRLWVFRFATLYVCEHWLHMGVRSIWYSVVVSNALSSVILYVVYRTGLWKKKRG